ncbi:MAG: zf-HC2 domain-containing protein [Candidatus Krumholzibacteriota bacterium]|nr:zf-HC2 domain-containing protein [Candidatus Krumholzibacteriota bacterium]
MKGCEYYEVEISALLDGESDPARAVEILDHVTRCPSCRQFYQELRSFQSLVDEMQEQLGQAPAEKAAGSVAPGLWERLHAVPQWAWGMAAALVVAVGLWGLHTGGILSPYASSDQPVRITLESEKNSMNDRRFMEVMTELLQADRRYHQAMFDVLSSIENDEQRATGEQVPSQVRAEDTTRPAGETQTADGRDVMK